MRTSSIHQYGVFLLVVCLAAGVLAGSASAQESDSQAAYEGEEDPDRLWATVFDNLECALQRAEITLQTLPASDEDPALATAAGAASAESLRTVYRVVALLELADDLPEAFPAERLSALRGRLQSSANQLSRLSISTQPIPPGPTLPPPPDPFCMWLCELLNRLGCRLNPDCLLTPCALFC